MNRLKGSFLLSAVGLVLVCGLSAWKSFRLQADSCKHLPIDSLVACGLPPAANNSSELNWMSIEEAAGKLKQEQRPVLIDLYTTWCGWCKQMDKKTYSNKQVAQYLKEKFYPVKVDAETHAAIQWNGRTYQFNANYRANEFALYLAHGQLEFPTTIIIPPGGEPQAIPGYMEPKELELLVKYFGEGKYSKMSFDEFQKSFKATW
ncbi:DUF255 domain-containing protein [Flavitalea sp. BT771]|uniref:thioredoxin family protein n=1 Tax=Flavitalea sp. BT771 TaxID=3063329 RepID=UPI0026E3FFB0|nr:DUF255 domain-containing protein [Flavitalea sp. BT771]MDO6429891.1 DUF255 domain-containing protein [Flavitalea sp. BT771]MDV6217981.1 DUF255 domain-containing protein [Flavitalea sp. BT771]